MSDVAMPTTPAINANITKKPVAMFPTGKYIGKIFAGRDSVDAAQTKRLMTISILKTLDVLLVKKFFITGLASSFDAVINSP